MLRILTCVVHEHDLRLVAVSAVICGLGCHATTTLLGRSFETGDALARRWVAAAAAVFGCSVWALHFVAMLAFAQGVDVAYGVGLTATSAVVATVGAWVALSVWRGSLGRAERVVGGGVALGLSVSGMHYLGVAAMTASTTLAFDRDEVLVSVGTGVAFCAAALWFAGDLVSLARRVGAAALLAVGICGMHFAGMSAVTVSPGPAEAAPGAVIGTASLAAWVGGASLAILVASLVAAAIERRMSRRAAEDLRRLRLMSNLAREAILIHRDGEVLEVNEAGERLLGMPAGRLVGADFASLFARGRPPSPTRRDRVAGSPAEELAVVAAGGAEVEVEATCQAIDYLGRPAVAVALRDLTDRRRDEARISHLARHDALTGLPNRHHLHERVEAALDDAARRRASLAMLYIDLDRFKSVNDLHGHAAGDALLAQAARRLLAEVEPTDTLARIGGDEFVILLSAGTPAERAAVVGARVVEAMRRPFEAEGRRLEVGASVGVALYPGDGGSADTLMRAADAAMYRVKDEGRGSMRFFEPAMNAQIQARLQLEGELAGAVERGEMELHYQPIVDAATGEVESLEALLRWNNPSRGMVPPSEFVPLAEQAGTIDAIGRWVIDAAIREAAGWERPSRVSINVSPRQCGHSDVCGAVAAALRTHGVAADRVEVEVTEGVLMGDAAVAVATLNRLRAMGVRVALDDFGTGFSSLSYLQLFKFDRLKIDMSFVRRLGRSEEALTLTRTIVNLGHNLGLEVTAEGVETATQLSILRGLGCDAIQGYLVARPAAAAAFGEAERRRAAALFAEGPGRAPALVAA